MLRDVAAMKFDRGQIERTSSSLLGMANVAAVDGSSDDGGARGASHHEARADPPGPVRRGAGRIAGTSLIRTCSTSPRDRTAEIRLDAASADLPLPPPTASRHASRSDRSAPRPSRGPFVRTEDAAIRRRSSRKRRHAGAEMRSAGRAPSMPGSKPVRRPPHRHRKALARTAAARGIGKASRGTSFRWSRRPAVV